MTSLPLELSEKLDGELRELRASHCQLQEEHQQLQGKMKFFSKVCAPVCHLSPCLFVCVCWLSICLSVGLPVCLLFYLSVASSTQESSVDWGEVEEALLLVKEGRGKGREGGKGKGAEPLPFLEKVEEEDKGVW